MTEIVLPIKCSTVKKIDSTIRILFLAMLGIYGGAAIPAWIYCVKTFGPYGGIGLINAMFLCASSVISVLDLLIIAYYYDEITRVFPTITCIKDEEEKE